MLGCCCGCGDLTRCVTCVGPEDGYILLICNINAARDDEFEVFVDGKSIGFVPETGFDKCQGKYFISDEGMKQTIRDIKCFEAPACCVEGTTSFQVVDGNVFRKSFLTLTLKTIKANYNGNYGVVVLYRVMKESGLACLIGNFIYGDGVGGREFRVSQNMCPPSPCRPCSSVKDNYVLSVGGSGGNKTFFDSSPDFIGEAGTFEFFVDGVSIFSKILFGGRCYQRLLVDDLRIAAKTYYFNFPCHFLWPHERIEKVVDKAFFLKDFLNVSAKFTPKIPEMNIHMYIVVSRLQEGLENLCPVAGANFFAGGSYPELPYQQAFSFDMKLCPRTPTTPPVLP